MTIQNIPFENVFDKFAIRIIYKSTHRNEKFLAWKIYSISQIISHQIDTPKGLDYCSQIKRYEALHNCDGAQQQMGRSSDKIWADEWNSRKGLCCASQVQTRATKILIESWLDKLQEVLKTKTKTLLILLKTLSSTFTQRNFVFTPTGDINPPKGCHCLILPLVFILKLEWKPEVLESMVN